MAIAYFIPDQAKLLAGQRSSTANNNNTGNRNRSTNQANARVSREAPTTSHSAGTSQLNTNVNRGYGTTINISVPTFNTTPQETLGCWDFLTQVFCYALRFYHESSQLQPTVIQISVNFNAQTNATDTTATTATTATTTSMTSTTTTTTTTAVNDSADHVTSTNETSNNLATAAATTSSSNVDHKPKKFSKRKN